MQNRSLTPDEEIAMNLLFRSLRTDESDVESTNKDYAYYLHLAIENYIRSLLLENSDESSSVFRLFGLWFANTSDVNILNEMKNHYERIPSHRFIALMPQITAQISSDVIKGCVGQIISEYCLSCRRFFNFFSSNKHNID